MAESVSDGDDYAHHRQLVLADVVNPISHSISSSSSPNSSLFPPNDGSAVQTVPGSDDIRSNPATPNMIGTSSFTLPKGWSVRKVHRKSGGTIDKYYHDPESGRQFRSLKEVERYITEGHTPTRTRLKKPNNHREKNSGSQDMTIVANEKVSLKNYKIQMLKVEEDEKDNQYQLATVSVGPTNASPTPPFQLPHGWVVKEVPRISGDYSDKYYFEPGTGARFRSLVAVQKHLTEAEENSPLSVALEEIRDNSLPISKAFKLSTTIKNYGSYNSWKKSIISRKEKTSLCGTPPNKINWVIDGSGGDTWNAFVDDTLVQDSVKKQWGDSFMVAITNGKHNTPVSG